MFNFNLAAIPSISTRKALIIIDLQNDFVGPDAVLPVAEPEGFVFRTLDLVRAFRDSGAGDVIWVRSEFQQHRSLTCEGDQIITSDLPQRPSTASRMSSRGRQPSSKLHDGALMEMDEESFLSDAPDSDKPSCVRKGTPGVEFPPEIQQAIDSRDIVFTKTHYSAFAQQELVQMLRGRLVTEMFVCGSLTNIGIYATALDAGRHGYEMTIVEDCCGFRSEMRHANAVRQLMQLVGSEAMNAETIIEKLQPPKPKAREMPKPAPPKTPPKSRTDKLERPTAATGSGSASGRDREVGASRGEGAVGASQKPPVRSQEPRVPSSTSASTGLSPSLSKVSLSRSDESPAATSSARLPEECISTTGQVQGQIEGESTGAEGEVQTLVTERPSTASSTKANPRPSFWVDSSAPLEADSDPGSDTPSLELVDVAGESRYRGSAAAEMRSRMSRVDMHVRPSGASYSPRSGQVAATQPPVSGSVSAVSSNNPAAPERVATRIAARTKRRVRGSSSNTPASSPNKQDKILAAQPSSSPSSSSSSPSPAVSKPKLDQPSPRSDPNLNPARMAEQPSAPVFTKPICEGDTTIILNALSPSLASDAFERLLKEVSWAGMSRMGGEVPRRIAVQGDVDSEGNMPVYRHPADESPPLLPFSPTVEAIKNEIETHLGHPLNHVLIQHYRSGNDYISEHSDKTLDIVPGSYIANVSLGAERTMVFRTKRPARNHTTVSSPHKDATPTPPPPGRQTERAPLPHNSLCRMGLQTNMRWLHAIRQDKRLEKEKSPAELSHNGERISLTFRHIGTFLDSTQTKIWGQGAVSKSKDFPGEVINGQDHAETVKLLQAFGAENNSSEFDWQSKYGGGFNVLHMGSPKRFCAGSNPVQNMRVRLALAEMGIGGCAGGSVDGDMVRFEDNDPGRAVVDDHGDGNVLRYLDAVYGAGRRYDQIPAAEVARRFVRLQKGLDFLEVWRRAKREAGISLISEDGDREARENEEESKGDRGEEKVLVQKLGKVKEFKAALVQWEGIARESATAAAAAAKRSCSPGADEASGNSGTIFYIAGGDRPSPADFALWPVLEDIVRVCGCGVFELAIERPQPVAKSGVQSQSQSKKGADLTEQKDKSSAGGGESSGVAAGGEGSGGGGGDGYLARYYASFGSRSAVRKVIEAEGGQGQGQTLATQSQSHSQSVKS